MVPWYNNQKFPVPVLVGGCDIRKFYFLWHDNFHGKAAFWKCYSIGILGRFACIGVSGIKVNHYACFFLFVLSCFYFMYDIAFDFLWSLPKRIKRLQISYSDTILLRILCNDNILFGNCIYCGSQNIILCILFVSCYCDANQRIIIFFFIIRYLVIFSMEKIVRINFNNIADDVVSRNGVLNRAGKIAKAAYHKFQRNHIVCITSWFLCTLQHFCRHGLGRIIDKCGIAVYCKSDACSSSGRFDLYALLLFGIWIGTSQQIGQNAPGRNQPDAICLYWWNRIVLGIVVVPKLHRFYFIFFCGAILLRQNNRICGSVRVPFCQCISLLS